MAVPVRCIGWCAGRADGGGVGVMDGTTPQTHVARKRHRCDWCDEFIEPGDKYVRWRWFDYGDAGTCKMHPECYEAGKTLDWDEGFWPGHNPRGAVAE